MKRNMFDYMEKDPEQLDIKQVQEETGIDQENVMALFREKIAQDSKNGKVIKMKKRNKGKIILAAAAAAVLTLGTATAAAAGGFNKYIAEHFAGESVDGMFVGGNSDIKTSPEYKAELAGITGDENTVISVLNIRRADGSGFISNDEDISKYKVISRLENWYHPENSSEMPSYYDESGDYEYWDVDYSMLQELTHKLKGDGYSGNHGGFSSYSLSTPDTINVVYSISREDNMKGQKMSAELEDMYLLKELETVCEYELKTVPSDMDENESKALEEEAEKWNDEQNKKAEAKCDEIYKTVGENILITRKIVPDKVNENGTIDHLVLKCVLNEVTKLDLDMKGSWALNYKTVRRSMKTTGQQANIKGHDFKFTDVNIGAMTIKLTAKVTNGSIPVAYNPDRNLLEEALEWNKKNIVITLKNGEKVYASAGMYGENKSNMDNTYTVEAFISRSDVWSDEDYDTSSIPWIAVDPEEVASVEICGYTVTEKLKSAQNPESGKYGNR